MTKAGNGNSIQGWNNNKVKQQNKGLILSLIARGLCTSRAEMARMSGLSKMTVTNIIAELIKEGIVIEEGYTENGAHVGRNPIGLDISPDAPKMIGILIRRNRCIVTLCDLKMNVICQEQHFWVDCSDDILFRTVCVLIDQVLEKEKNIIGIGVGVVGQPDSEKGMILSPINFFGIHDYPIGEMLEEAYGVPVYVENQDAAAAIGETYYGIGREYQSFIFIGIGSGIGSGVVRNGKVEHNTRGIGSEAGHISIDYKGEKCPCGNQGCMELYCGGRALEKEAFALTGEHVSVGEIFRRSSEPIFSKMLQDWLERFAVGLTNVANITNPEAIIIGEEGFLIPDEMLEYLENRINELKYVGDYYHCKVVHPGMRLETETIGCAAIVAEKMFLGELLF